jgi:AraC-like DNA-binding protein/mannose-6-phosphate isomerase-like protein (cupin superfamily)
MATPTNLLSLSMIMNRRNRLTTLSALTRAADRLVTPRDYYHGHRCPTLDWPDNILLFCRRSEVELQDGSLQPHFHHRWVLVVPLRGRGTVVVDESEFPLWPGRTLLVPPLRLHQYRSISPGLIHWLFLTFELPAADAGAAKPEPGRLAPAARRVLGEVLNLWPRTGLDPLHAARLAMQVALLLLSVRQTAPAPPTVVPAGPPAVLGRINEWLHAHRDGPVRLPELARGIGCSESHLRAVFRQHFGLSLGRYVRETRCRLAALRLQEGRLTVTEAAAACGFTSVYTFSRTFKRVLGVPPSTMRSRPLRPRQAEQPSPPQTRIVAEGGAPARRDKAARAKN